MRSFPRMAAAPGAFRNRCSPFPTGRRKASPITVRCWSGTRSAPRHCPGTVRWCWSSPKCTLPSGSTVGSFVSVRVRKLPGKTQEQPRRKPREMFRTVNWRDFTWIGLSGRQRSRRCLKKEITRLCWPLISGALCPAATMPMNGTVPK